ncbi:MAG TPA: hypothetical protein VHE13_05840 [Opitutus sp.]|nr:hypothetical protein [Opitutus sp.]
MSEPGADDRKPVQVSLPVRHWIVVLALVEAAVHDKIMPEWDQLRKRGATADDLPESERTALTGPIFARAAIVKALHAAGIMTAEANMLHGSDALNALIRRYQNDHDDKET